MRCLMLLLLCPWMATASPMKLIIDTDFDSDVDDVAAPTLAQAYVILATERKRLEERR